MKETSKTEQENPQEVQTNKEGDDQGQELLRNLMKRGLLELKPTLNKLGVHYLEAEEICKSADLNQVRALLENLAKRGVLKSEFLDHVLTCPDCGSPEVYSKYTCPKCDSQNVEYSELLEHSRCGYIGPRENFRTDSHLVCPNCQTKFPEEFTHCRVIGRCYLCEKCGYHFDKPEIVHVCQRCGRNFAYQEAKYIKIFTYKIPDEINHFKGEPPVLESIKKILTEKGFKVKLHPQITGSSGTRHTFDILAERNETRLVIDVSLTGKKSDGISLLVKKIDVNPTKAIIIDLSNLDELTPLEKIYNITVLKATSSHLLNYENFQSTLDSIDSHASVS